MLRKALEICGIQTGEWFSVAAIRDRDIRPGCFCDVAQAEAFLAEYAGWNHYLCGNPVRAGTVGKPKLDDVVEARVMLVDADPSTDNTEHCATAIEKVAKYLQDCKWAIIDSGRGRQLWLRTSLGAVERRALLRHIARTCATPGVKFDATHNAERLMRLPGSVNLKTGRTATIVHEQGGFVFDAKLFEERQIPLEDPIDLTQTTFAEGVATDADKALLTNDAKEVWDEPAGKGERSKRDFRFVLCLIRAKIDEAAACRLLRAMPGSKFAADKRGEDYWRATMESVRRHLAAEEAALARARSLPERAKEDAGAAFEPAALDDLIMLREGPQADWQRLRAALKASKVPIRQLEQAMDARIRESKEVEDPSRLRFVADAQKRIGWFKQTRDEAWVAIDSAEARSTMRAQGQDPDEEVKALTDAPWALVNEPFQKEELEGRRWNKDGASFAVKPEEGPCPTWLSMLDHVGKSLDDVVRTHDWCQRLKITTGGGYLLRWIAAMLQRPKARSAYLFLHGPQEAGKSTLHEALRVLFHRGYVRANHALKSKEGFNGEIANAILCVVEEVDLSDPKRDTHERVKDWVTGEVISVRAMYRQALDYANTTHWIQCAQKRSFMPVLPGDTRITEILVERAENPIPKETLLKKLTEEAPAFLSLALREPMHEPDGRLYVPALQTQGKEEQADAAKTLLEIWMDQTAWMELSENQLASAFLEWLPSHARSQWDMGKVIRELPPGARAEGRLAVALRGALGPGALAVSGLLAVLPPGVRADWRDNPVILGKAVRRIAPRLPWLETVTVRGTPVWRLVGSATATPTPTPTP